MASHNSHILFGRRQAINAVQTQWESIFKGANTWRQGSLDNMVEAAYCILIPNVQMIPGSFHLFQEGTAPDWEEGRGWGNGTVRKVKIS